MTQIADQPRIEQAAALAAASRRRAVVAWVICSTLLLCIAGMLDRPVAQWVREKGIDHVVARALWAHMIKAPGTYYFTLVVAAVLLVLHPKRWQAAGFLALSGATGLLNSLVKWLNGRVRPFRLHDVLNQPAPFDFQPFRGGFVALFTQTNLSLPSGHTCIAFAAAESMAILLPRWRWWFYAVAGLVALERIAENAHYVSDTVAGAILAILGVRFLMWVCRRYILHEIGPGSIVPAAVAK